MAEARRFRAEFGLRRDDAWIIAIETDPAASHDLGVALTLSEANEIKRRPLHYEAVTKVVQRYAESEPSVWAGLFIDQTRGGIVVGQFTDDIDRHSAALHLLLQPEAPLELRRVRWSLAELQTLADKVFTDQAWLKTIPAVWNGSGVDISDNWVLLTVSSRNPNAAELITNHYDAAGMIEVESDGTGALLLPWGILVVKAKDTSGHPVRGLMCIPDPDIAGAFDDAATYGTDKTGTCRLPARAGGYEVRLEIQHSSGERLVVGSGRVVVPADGVGTVVIRVATQ